jgi:hypothetical protein
MAKQRNAFGLTVPEHLPAVILTFRLTGVNARKLAKLGKELKVGRSKMARLIIEKFIEEHDPERGR